MRCSQRQVRHLQATWTLSSSNCTSSRSSICSSRQSISTSNSFSIKLWCKLKDRCQLRVKPLRCLCRCRHRWWEWTSRPTWPEETWLEWTQASHRLQINPKEITHQKRDEEAALVLSPRMVTFWHFNCSIWTTVSKSFHAWPNTMITSSSNCARRHV